MPLRTPSRTPSSVLCPRATWWSTSSPRRRPRRSASARRSPRCPFRESARCTTCALSTWATPTRSPSTSSCPATSRSTRPTRSRRTWSAPSRTSCRRSSPSSRTSSRCARPRRGRMRPRTRRQTPFAGSSSRRPADLRASCGSSRLPTGSSCSSRWRSTRRPRSPLHMPARARSRSGSAPPFPLPTWWCTRSREAVHVQSARATPRARWAGPDRGRGRGWAGRAEAAGVLLGRRQRARPLGLRARRRGAARARAASALGPDLRRRRLRIREPRGDSRAGGRNQQPRRPPGVRAAADRGHRRRAGGRRHHADERPHRTGAGRREGARLRARARPGGRHARRGRSGGGRRLAPPRLARRAEHASAAGRPDRRRADRDRRRRRRRRGRRRKKSARSEISSRAANVGSRMSPLRSVTTRRLIALGALVGLSALVVTMVAVRISATGSLDYFNLVWNLVLAWIPLGLALILYDGARRGVAGHWLLSLGALWLLFFPNAPYLMTDLKYLSEVGGAPFWFDAVLAVS